MSIIVQKFGGTSVADTEKLFNVCKHIIKEHEKNNKVVVVVSAQGKTTDKLLEEARQIDSNMDSRELDMLLAVGEQITISKLAMCIKKIGYEAVSLTGWQVPIKTTNVHGNSDITRIDTDRILEELDNHKIVIIAGFQGINADNDVTTLGRGGSDTTAVALAAALKADRCDIFTDVDGVYNKDPNLNRNAIKFESISYDDMLMLANSGAKVLHNKCIEIGKKFNVPIYVKSSFIIGDKGTFVGKR